MASQASLPSSLFVFDNFTHLLLCNLPLSTFVCLGMLKQIFFHPRYIHGFQSRYISLFHPTKVHLSLFLHIIYLRSFLSKSLSSIFVSLYRHAFSLSVHIISIHGSINHFPYLLLLRRMSFFARKYYYIFRVCLNSLSFPTVKPLTISLFLRLPSSMSIYTFTAFLNTSCTFSLLSF